MSYKKIYETFTNAKFFARDNARILRYLDEIESFVKKKEKEEIKARAKELRAAKPAKTTKSKKAK